MQNTITINELEQLFHKFLTQLRNDKIEKVGIDEDMYWNISEAQWLDLKVEPEIHVGSIGDDLKFLRMIINEEIGLSYDGLERLSVLLRVIGNKLNKE